MAANDFGCILDGTKVRRFYVQNPLGHLDEAIAVANNPDGGRYPVGTIIQLIPTEAFVKRHNGWNEQTHDWEFFFLSVDSDGTEILSRGDDPAVGATGVENTGGGNCYDCHDLADDKYDMICEQENGCVPLPFNEQQIATVQSRDPRCD